MASVTRLIKDAKDWSQLRGHKLTRFTHEGNGSAYAYCETGCGMGAFVNSQPAPNGIGVHGRAVAVHCPNAVLDSAHLDPKKTRIKHIVNGDTSTYFYCYACDFITKDVGLAAAHDGTYEDR